MKKLCLLFFLFFCFPSSAFAFRTVVVEVEKNKLIPVLQQMKELVPDGKVNAVFREIFYGFSLQSDELELEKLGQLPFIKSISPVTTFHVKAMESVPLVPTNFSNTSTGKGVKVGIIDTGIDYTHPDLKDNYKGGYDAIDKDNDPMETVKGQGIPTVHGTHVAGIIAGNGVQKGIAPRASIYAYRALGSGGIGTTESVLLAMEKVVEDGVDILNLSLGNNINAPDWPTSVALNKLVEKGITVVTAAGNAGPDKWTVGAPGTAREVLSVGASSPEMNKAFLQTRWSKKLLAIEPLQDAQPVGSMKGFLVDGNDRKAHMKNKIVLFQRGKGTFADLGEKAQEAGAKGVIIYNHVPGNFTGKLGKKLEIPVVSLSKEEGEWLKEQIKLGNRQIKTVYQQTPVTLASFSSRGPVTKTWEIKPDILAPGVGIFSTIPGGYQFLQGTSMASPFAAGVLVLLKEKHPSWSPEQLKSAVINTAKQLPYGHIYEQGAGAIQVEKALQTETLITPSALSLGVIKEKQKVDIFLENISHQKKKYTFTPSPDWVLPTTIYVLPHERKKVTIFVKPTESQEGTIHINDGVNDFSIPYLFFTKEPDHPTVIGFQLGKEGKNEFTYEVYFTEPVKELTLFLYHPATLTEEAVLSLGKNLPQGRVRKTILSRKQLQGTYKAILLTENNKTLETFIHLR